MSQNLCQTAAQWSHNLKHYSPGTQVASIHFYNFQPGKNPTHIPSKLLYSEKKNAQHNGISGMVNVFWSCISQLKKKWTETCLSRCRVLKVMQVYILESRLHVNEMSISSQVRVKCGFCRRPTNIWGDRLPDVQVEKCANQSSDQFPVHDVGGYQWTLQQEVLSCFQNHSGEEEETWDSQNNILR